MKNIKNLKAQQPNIEWWNYKKNYKKRPKKIKVKLN